VALSVLTTMFVEHPVRFGALRKWGVPVTVTAMTVVVAMSALIWRSGGLPWRYPSEIREVLATLHYDAATNARVPQCWLNMKQAFEEYNAECSRGATLIWGDSYSGSLYAGLRRNGVDIAQFTRDSCRPSTAESYENCEQGNRAVLRRIAELKPKTVILFANWAAYGAYQQDKVSDEGLVTVLTELKQHVDNVIVVGQAPNWPTDLPAAVYEIWHSTGKAPDRLAPKPLPYDKINTALAAMSAAAHVRFASPYAALCNQEGCLTHTPRSNGELLSWDTGHLTVAGARYVGTLLQLD
jgi:hypothetical protein